jgi:hypothetical protein
MANVQFVNAAGKYQDDTVATTGHFPMNGSKYHLSQSLRWHFNYFTSCLFFYSALGMCTRK